jgi:hypothetical protein
MYIVQLYMAVWKKSTLQRHNTENSKKIFPEKKLLGLSPFCHIYVSVSDLCIPMIGLTILLQENIRTLTPNQKKGAKYLLKNIAHAIFWENIIFSCHVNTRIYLVILNSVFFRRSWSPRMSLILE